MIYCEVIGRIGADAEVKSSNGREFTTFRVAHSSQFKDAQGNVISETIWVDCVIPGKMNVGEFLKRGVQVYVSGNASLRIYSSKKDKCMKAGLTINVKQVELLGAKQDDIPSRLFRSDNGQEISVLKYYAMDMEGGKQNGNIKAVSSAGKEFYINVNGWITPIVNEKQDKRSEKVYNENFKVI